MALRAGEGRGLVSRPAGGRVYWETVRKGRRVKMTAIGQYRLVMSRQTRRIARVTTGVFLGVDRISKFFLRVRRDGHKGVDTYHPDFWQPR